MTKKPKFISAVALAAIFAAGGISSAQAGPSGQVSKNAAPTPASQVAAAVNLFNQKKYLVAADAFEPILRTATPEPRLYLYAGLANQQAGRAARARQLFDYITTNFAQASEATYVQKLNLPGGQTVVTTTTTTTTTGPKGTVANALASANAGSGGPTGAEAEIIRQMMGGNAPPTSKRVKGAQVFSEDEIAKSGANGISQSGYPNCWFQASMSALAQLPRGQRLLARMIHYGNGEDYVVRFPGDGVEYIVSEADCMANRIHNGALWASLLECAQIKKFPNNQGANGESGTSRLELGMSCITGCKAEELFPKGSDPGAISSFIGGALRSNSPIIAGSLDPMNVSGPQLTIGPHAYTIIGIEPSKNMVIFRNPHGRRGDRFSLPSDPQHLKFEQLDDGVFKMNIELIPTYFYSMARSNI
jgi:hypothetical protein